MAGSLFYDALFRAAGLFCHQLPERSPHLWAAQIPLCWRCTGIAIGACALLTWLLWRRKLPPPVLSLLLALALPLDVLCSSLAAAANTRRLITGILWGFFAGAASLHLLARLAARRDSSNQDTRPRASLRTQNSTGELAR